MNLIIVESPTKANTIKKFLGKDYNVLSSFGHVRDLPKSELGVDTENNFEPKYVIPPKSRKTITALKKGLEKAKETILATDEDREGESIAWHLSQVLKLDNPKRIVFHEITKTAIKEAILNPREIDINLVDAQQARRILDRIVGYKLSPFLWKKVARGLSAGRVQSVAVRLVAEREDEIKKFKTEEYWTITALLKKQTNEFEASLVKKDREIIPKLGIKSKKEADNILKELKGAEYRVESIEKKELKRNPPPPFSTSSLQQEAWKRFRFPAKFTMGLAQQLYEKGYITYHRTDSLNLSQQSLFSAKEFIEKNFGKNYWAGFFKKYKAKGKAQEAHEAIRPASAERMPESLIAEKIDENQQKLYDLIWRRFIACQMAQANFDSTVAEIETKNKYTFRATGQILKFDGFLKIYPVKYAAWQGEPRQGREEKELPSLEINEILDLKKLSHSQHFTEPPPRYNEASLIKALEENGIGRPSTYAPTLSTIQERNYIEKDDQKRFMLTEIGTVVNDILVKHFPEIVDIKFTAGMEENLDKIAEGKKKWVSVCKDFYGPFEKNLKEKYEKVLKKGVVQEKTGKNCPECGSPLLIRLGKFGKFYACSGFPKCRYTESLEKKTLGIKCLKCQEGDIIEKRTKRKKMFYGCNRFPKCDFALWDKPTGEKCPECGSLLVETKKKQIHPVKSDEVGVSPTAKQFNGVKCSNKDCQFKKNLAE